jgi:hypothetical protein
MGGLLLQADPSRASSPALETDVAQDELSMPSFQDEQSAPYLEAEQRGRQLTKLFENYLQTLKTKNDPLTYEAIESFKGREIIIDGELIERTDPAVLQLFRSSVKYVTHLDSRLLRYPMDNVEIVCLAKVSDIIVEKGEVRLETIDARIETTQ